MDFDDRLKKAVQRGKLRGDETLRKQREKELSEQEVKQRHSQYRLELSDHIEKCMQRLPNFFPGFQYETVFGDRGWGGACHRDDLDTSTTGRSGNLYSRLEITIRPMSKYPILEMTVKGTIRNKEVYSRKHFSELENVDLDVFVQLIDNWIIEFAELYAAEK